MTATRTAAVLGAAATAVVAVDLASCDQPGAGPQAAAGQGNRPVTLANGSTPPGERPSPDAHGNAKLWTRADLTFVTLVEHAGR